MLSNNLLRFSVGSCFAVVYMNVSRFEGRILQDRRARNRKEVGAKRATGGIGRSTCSPTICFDLVYDHVLRWYI